MDNNSIVNVYDLLNQDAEFARQVSDIHSSAAEAAQAVEALAKHIDRQQTVSDELNGLIDQAESELSQLRAERDQLKRDIRRYEEILAEMQRLEESFNGALTAYGNISNVFQIFENRFTELEKRIGTRQTPAAASAQPAPKPVAAERPFVPFADVDYTEVTSVEELFRKYSGRIEGPVIVVRTKTYPWNGDYCMAVKSVNHGKAWGIRYSYGVAGKKTPLNATEEDYSMYKGANYWKIAEDFKNQK